MTILTDEMIRGVKTDDRNKSTNKRNLQSYRRSQTDVNGSESNKYNNYATIDTRTQQKHISDLKYAQQVPKNKFF